MLIIIKYNIKIINKLIIKAIRIVKKVQKYIMILLIFTKIIVIYEALCKMSNSIKTTVASLLDDYI